MASGKMAVDFPWYAIEKVKIIIAAGADTTIQNNDGYLYNQVIGWSARVYFGNRSLPDI